MTSLVDEKVQQKVNKKYSKNGCKECKRRKIKCDETKPMCLKCTRLDKVCVYPKDGEKVLRVLKKFLAQNPDLNLENFTTKKSRNPPQSPKSQQESQKVVTNSDDTPAGYLNGNSLPSGETQMMHYPPQGLGNQGEAYPVQQYQIGIGMQYAPYGSAATHIPQNPQAPPPPNHQGPPTLTAAPTINAAPINAAPTLTQNRDSIPPHLQGHNPIHTGSIPQLLPPGMIPQASPEGIQYQPQFFSGSLPSPVPNLSALHPGQYRIRSSQGANVISPAPILAEQATTDSTSPLSKASNHSGAVDSHSLGQDHGMMKSDGDMLFDSYFNREDMHLLANDLNSLVGSIMVESNFSRQDDFDMASLESTSSSINNMASPSIPIMRSIYSNSSETRSIPYNLPFDFIKLKNLQEKFYLENFYLYFAPVLFPLNAFDEAVGGYFNPVRDSILFCAAKEPLLLAAVLALGAKAAHSRTNYTQYEEAYCSYLLKCLKLLGPALNVVPLGEEARKKFASNIEPVLITVLLLTSANASNIKQDWRPHLKGAKDLLLKYSAHSNLKESKLLIFCKMWFILFDFLAGLSSQKGGTLQSDEELDMIMKLDENEISVLKEMKIVTDDGFNLMFGFHNDLLPTIKDLIKFLNGIRESKSSTPKGALYSIRLLSEFYQQSKTVFVHKKVYLTPEDFPNRNIPNGLLLDMIPGKGQTIVVNWKDISHQAYCLGGMLSVLTKGFCLEFDNEQVKPVTQKLVDLMSILNDIPVPAFTTYKPLMIQWAMLIAGLNCYEESQKLLIQQFFRISGAGSATFSIKLIDKVWNKRTNNITDESDVDIDLVTY